MIPTEEQCQYIKDAFIKMKSKEDFLILLNFAKTVLYGEKGHPFLLKQVHFHAHPKLNEKRYEQFTIKKKSGGERVIHAPNEGLKALQQSLNLILQVVYEPHQHKAATGFVPGKSIVANAQIHAGSLYVYNLDLKDFFPSIDQARVWGRLQHPPFNLNKKTNRLELANIIASLCCHQMEVERKDDQGNWNKELRSVLPQGAPTSPTLTNIICQRLDIYLSAAAKRFGLKYSRYADDITFSSQHNSYQPGGEFLKELHRIIAQQNFHIKESKTRLQKTGYRQEVTGLIVNDKVNVRKRYVKELRMWLYYWETYGHERTYENFIGQYVNEKSSFQYLKEQGSFQKSYLRQQIMIKIIRGKLDYIKMVKGMDNGAYSKLKDRFDKLKGDESISKTHLEKVLDALLTKGLDEAMNIYK